VIKFSLVAPYDYISYASLHICIHLYEYWTNDMEFPPKYYIKELKNDKIKESCNVK